VNLTLPWAVVAGAAILGLAWFLTAWWVEHHRDRREDSDDFAEGIKKGMQPLRELMEDMGAVKPKIVVDEDRESRHPFGGA
jgi:hypothetical protein